MQQDAAKKGTASGYWKGDRGNNTTSDIFCFNQEFPGDLRRQGFGFLGESVRPSPGTHVREAKKACSNEKQKLFLSFMVVTHCHCAEHENDPQQSNEPQPEVLRCLLLNSTTIDQEGEKSCTEEGLDKNQEINFFHDCSCTAKGR